MRDAAGVAIAANCGVEGARRDYVSAVLVPRAPPRHGQLVFNVLELVLSVARRAAISTLTPPLTPRFVVWYDIVLETILIAFYVVSQPDNTTLGGKISPRVLQAPSASG